MKELRISELMDGYQDDGFFPEGERGADPDAVAARVLRQVRGAAPAKQKMPRRKKLLLAGALAAVLLVLVGAGFPSKLYQLATGGSLEFYRDANSRVISLRGGDAPLELEDGRLFCVLDGGHMDMTGLMDWDTPYIRDLSNPAEDMTHYLVMGGTPERYGWFEWFVVPDPFDQQEGDSILLATEDGWLYTYDFTFVTAEEQEGLYTFDEFGSYTSGGAGTGSPDWAFFTENLKWAEADYQWLRTAADQLGIPFIDSTGEPKTTIREE